MSSQSTSLTVPQEDVERRVLGAVLLTNSLWPQVAKLHPADFSVSAHQAIFARMAELIERGEVVEYANLAEALGAKKQLEVCGGITYLSTLTEGAPVRSNITRFVDIVRRHAVKRHVAAVAEAINRQALEAGAEIADLAARVEELEAWIKSYQAADTWRSLFHTIEEFEKAPPLQFAINGFCQEAGIGLIAGLVGHGKTLVMLAMVRSMLDGTPLFDYDQFAVPKISKRILYLVPESSIGPFWTRMKLFRLQEHVRQERLFVRTLSSREQVSLNDPRILEAAAGCDIFLDTAVRFMDGPENNVENTRIFAGTLFNLLAAGARTVTGAHHAPKGFESQERMTLENILRGSGDMGAMLCTAWGVRQVDPVANRIYVENVKPRDFLPCKPFVVEGRPHLNQSGRFKMIEAPGTATSLGSYKSNGRPPMEGKQEKLQTVRQLRTQDLTIRQIADAVGISYSGVRKWLQELKIEK